MVNHAHRKDGIETVNGQYGRRPVCHQGLQGERQYIEGGFGQVLGNGALLHDVTECGVGSDYPLCAGPQHAPAVITVAATDVQDGAPGQRGNPVLQAAPFHIGTPFRVDLQAEQVERTLAPWQQPLQLPAHGVTLRYAAIRRGAYEDCIRIKVDCRRADFRQAVECVNPVGKITMACTVVEARQARGKYPQVTVRPYRYAVHHGSPPVRPGAGAH